MSASSIHIYTEWSRHFDVLKDIKPADFWLWVGFVRLHHGEVERKGLEWSLTIISGQIVIESESTKPCRKR